LKNHWKKVASKPGTLATGGLHFPYTGTTNSQAVLDTRHVDPQLFWLKLYEKMRIHAYNVGNTIAFVTLCRYYPKRNFDDGSAHTRACLVAFPLHYAATPLPANITSLSWGYPVPVYDEKDPWKSRGCPWMPSIKDSYDNASYGGTLVPFGMGIPRMLGAFLMRYPFEPKISFLPQNATNLFNQNANGGSQPRIDQDYFNKLGTTSPTAGQVQIDAVDWDAGVTNSTKILGGGTNQANMINRGAAAITANISTPNTIYYPDGATAGSTNWASSTEYPGDDHNPMMRRLFKMKCKRFTIPPGGAIRFTVKAPRVYNVNPVRHNFIGSLYSPWNVNSGGQVMTGWGSASQTHAHNSMSMPYHGGVWTCPLSWSMRGQTAVDVKNTDATTAGFKTLGQTMGAEVLIKKDFLQYYNFRYSLPRSVKSHCTTRNLLGSSGTLTDYNFATPTSGAVINNVPAFPV